MEGSQDAFDHTSFLNADVSVTVPLSEDALGTTLVYTADIPVRVDGAVMPQNTQNAQASAVGPDWFVKSSTFREAGRQPYTHTYPQPHTQQPYNIQQAPQQPYPPQQYLQQEYAQQQYSQRYQQQAQQQLPQLPMDYQYASRALPLPSYRQTQPRAQVHTQPQPLPQYQPQLQNQQYMQHGMQHDLSSSPPLEQIASFAPVTYDSIANLAMNSRPVAHPAVATVAAALPVRVYPQTFPQPLAPLHNQAGAEALKPPPALGAKPALVKQEQRTPLQLQLPTTSAAQAAPYKQQQQPQQQQQQQQQPPTQPQPVLARDEGKHRRSQQCVCHICNKRLCNRTALHRHLLVHSGEKPFSCPVCHRLFRQKGTMTRHVSIHTQPERPPQLY